MSPNKAAKFVERLARLAIDPELGDLIEELILEMVDDAIDEGRVDRVAMAIWGGFGADRWRALPDERQEVFRLKAVAAIRAMEA